MVWLPDGEKFDDTIIRFDEIHERDGHTDTAWRLRPHTMLSSRGKNSLRIRNDRRRPWCTLTDVDTADAQQLHWRRDPA